MRHFLVSLPDQTKAHVRADYFKIETGTLVFRNVTRATDGYPTFVKCFAAGAWSTVEVTP